MMQTHHIKQGRPLMRRAVIGPGAIFVFCSCRLLTCSQPAAEQNFPAGEMRTAAEVRSLSPEQA
jgi:hypothetical protein